MARKRRRKQRTPGMVRHSSGQARLTLNGKTFYLGAFGTAQAAQRYAELLGKWEANGRQPFEIVPDVEQAKTMRELFAAWEQQLDASGRYSKGSRPTSQRGIVSLAVREFVERFGDVPANKYRETLLLQHRDTLEQRPRLTRAGINRKVAIIRAGLKWAFGRGHLSRDAWLGTTAIDPLTRAEAGNRDRKKDKRAVSLEDVAKVAACLPRVPAAMLRLQAMLGCRPGEICSLRWQDIDKTLIEGCWTYRVADGKTAHHGLATSYAIPPEAQMILEQFPPTKPGAFVFAPSQAMLDLHEARRAARETPETKQRRDRDAAPGREFSERYTTPMYRQAIERGIKRAKVAPFSPHEIRHGAITRACARFGAFAASVFANHSRVSTTEGYLHAPDLERYRVAVGLAADAAPKPPQPPAEPPQQRDAS